MDTVRADSFELAAEIDPSDDPIWTRALSLERATTTSSWTVPAVGSLLTGLWPRRHGAGWFPQPVANLGRNLPLVLDPSARTLAERLHAQGFETAGFVEHQWLQPAGFARGFDDWSFLEDPRAVERALESWLAGRDPSRRFLLYIHLMDAHDHTPVESEQEARVAQLSPDQQARVVAAAPGLLCEDPRAFLCRRYLAYLYAIVQVRRTVSGMLSTLERHGELERSVVVLFSDHGEEFLEHVEIESQQKLDPRNLYGVGHGHSLFGEQLRIPLLIWHPELRGGASEVPASLVDVAPTVFDFLGLAHPGADGHSLRGALQGERFDPERVLYASGMAFGPPRQAVVRGRWKAITGDGVPPLLYDLERDPHEHSPIAADPGGMLALSEAYTGITPGDAGGSLPDDSQSLEALRALGYLQDGEER